MINDSNIRSDNDATFYTDWESAHLTYLREQMRLSESFSNTVNSLRLLCKFVMTFFGTLKISQSTSYLP